MDVANIELAADRRGEVVAVDLAGPDRLYDGVLSELTPLFKLAKKHDLHTTAHLFETTTGISGVGLKRREKVLPMLDRVGHGIQIPLQRPSLLKAIVESGWSFIPGCATPSEALTLADAGFKVVKLFPAEVVGGLNMIKSLASPLPHIQFMPTGGVRLEKVADYVAQPNVVALGGTWIAPADKLANNDFVGIQALAREAFLAAQSPQAAQ